MLQNFSVATSTVGDFFVKLQNHLNRNAADKRLHQNHTVADEYVFQIDPLFVGETITPKSPDENPDRNANFKSDDGSTTVSFNDGTDVYRIVDSIMACTRYLQEGIKNTSSLDKNDADRQEVFKKFYRVYSQVDNTMYDPGRGDYARKYTYTIKPYEAATIQSTASETGQTMSSEQRYNTFLANNRIKKRYDYIFTGLNDQVEEINLNFNYAFYPWELSPYNIYIHIYYHNFIMV
jgi:hypothetical protein